MPVYVYKCELCGIQEIKQSITEKRLENCPRCGTLEFKKVMVPATAHFKGSGFYSTDKGQ